MMINSLMLPYVTGHVLERVHCLGQNNRIHGTGFAVEVDGKQYLVTAEHVARACQYEPLLLMGGWDASFNWKTIGRDKDADVAVLAADRQLCAATPIQIGSGKILYGQMGYALGFPADYGTDIFGKLESDDYGTRALPMPAPATFYGSGNTWQERYWGSVAAGFSGAPVVFPTVPDQSARRNPLGSENWAITGMVTGYATRRFEADQDGATLDLKVSYDQPVGIVNVTKQTVFLEIIRSNPQGFPHI